MSCLFPIFLWVSLSVGLWPAVGLGADVPEALRGLEASPQLDALVGKGNVFSFNTSLEKDVGADEGANAIEPAAGPEDDSASPEADAGSPEGAPSD